MQAVNVIREEMEQNKTNSYVQAVGDFLLKHLAANPGDAEKISAEKTLISSMDALRKEAEKKKTGNFYAMPPDEGFKIILEYFGITDAQVNVQIPAAPEKKALDFDVKLDDLLRG